MITECNINVIKEMTDWLNNVSFREFYEEMSKRVIGQEEGLRLVLSEVRSYIEGLTYGASSEGGNKHNLIIAAGSGAGKTETYRSLKSYFAKHLPSLQVTIYDVSNLTAAGYKGSEPSDILLPYQMNGETTPMGICFLDEFDKKLTPSYSGAGENVNAEVQSQLLTMIEGGDIYSKHGIKMNTERMMFIGLGSFSAFRSERTDKKRTVGIMTAEEREKEEEKNNFFAPITPEDMIKAGGSWELLGRFANVINYKQLSKQSIIRIIDKAAQVEADSIGVDLDIRQAAIDKLVEISSDSKFGCRFIYSKLHGVIMNAYSEALMTLPKNYNIKITINTMTNATYEYRPYVEEIEEEQRKETVSDEEEWRRENQEIDFWNEEVENWI